MAKENSGSLGSVGSGEASARLAKASMTRKINAEKKSKTSEPNQYAHKKIMAARTALEAVAERILNGGTATGELLDLCGQVESAVGKAMFA